MIPLSQIQRETFRYKDLLLKKQHRDCTLLKFISLLAYAVLRNYYARSQKSEKIGSVVLL